MNMSPKLVPHSRTPTHGTWNKQTKTPINRSSDRRKPFLKALAHKVLRRSALSEHLNAAFDEHGTRVEQADPEEVAYWRDLYD